MKNLIEDTFRIGVKYNPIPPIKQIEINAILDSLNSQKEIKIIEFVNGLFIIFQHNKYQCDIKIRTDGIIVIYSTHNFPTKYMQMKHYCVNLLKNSNEIMKYIKYNEIYQYDLKDEFQFIYHGRKEMILNHFINSILKIFKIRIMDDIYIRNGSAIISGLYIPKFI